MKQAHQKRLTYLEKELYSAEKQEKRYERKAFKEKSPGLKNQLMEKVPRKVYYGLESAFCKGFAAVFSQGRVLIERSYKRENILADHAVHDYAVDIKGGRKELKQLHKKSARSDFINLTVTGIEGVGLGALGIGMPDIVIFLGMILRGVYETALCYGFDYVSRHEQLLILKMLEASLSSGQDWLDLDEYVDELFEENEREISDAQYDLALRSCASAFAQDMLLLKFVQGLPVVGIIGGAANPVYYSKIMKYVSLKYRKHYLKRKLRELKT